MKCWILITPAVRYVSILYNIMKMLPTVYRTDLLAFSADHRRKSTAKIRVKAAPTRLIDDCTHHEVAPALDDTSKEHVQINVQHGKDLHSEKFQASQGELERSRSSAELYNRKFLLRKK